METYILSFMVCDVYVEQRIYLPDYCSWQKAEEAGRAIVSSINSAEFIELKKAR